MIIGWTRLPDTLFFISLLCVRLVHESNNSKDFRLKSLEQSGRFVSLHRIHCLLLNKVIGISDFNFRFFLELAFNVVFLAVH